MKISNLAILALGTLALGACNKNSNTASTTTAASITKHNTNRISGATMLNAPIAEQKIYKLLPGYTHSDNFEASGVYYLNGYFYVACDNMSKICKLKSTLPVNSSQNSLLSTGTPGSGSSNFEGITYDSYNTVNWYVVAESEQNGSVYQPRIYQYDASMNYQSRAWAQYYFNSSNNNKAFEGIAWLRRGTDDYILGLVEGTGKIPVLKQTSGDWVLVDSITLPSSVTFTDYSDIVLYGNKVAITSQVDGQLWVGTLSSTSWSITGGTAYEFPHGDINGNVGAGSYQVYGNVEGISFVNDTTIVIVSDKADNSQPTYQTYKDQSVSVFTIH